MSASEKISVEPQPLDEETRRQIDLVVDTQIRIIAGSYEKANAYTNLIILAGYAGLFALWQFTKDALTRSQVLLSGFFLLISIAIFVLFEIYKAYYTSRLLRKYLSVVQDSDNRSSPEKLLTAMNAFESSERAASVHFVRFWSVIFWLTTITGLGSAGVLGYSFVKDLIKH